METQQTHWQYFNLLLIHIVYRNICFPSFFLMLHVLFLTEKPPSFLNTPNLATCSTVQIQHSLVEVKKFLLNVILLKNFNTNFYFYFFLLCKDFIN